MKKKDFTYVSKERMEKKNIVYFHYFFFRNKFFSSLDLLTVNI